MDSLTQHAVHWFNFTDFLSSFGFYAIGVLQFTTAFLGDLAGFVSATNALQMQIVTMDMPAVDPAIRDVLKVYFQSSLL